MTSSEKENLKLRIDCILKRYEHEYGKLAQRSENLQLDQKALERDYKMLDKQTGLNALLEELAAVYEH